MLAKRIIIQLTCVQCGRLFGYERHRGGNLPKCCSVACRSRRHYQKYGKPYARLFPEKVAAKSKRWRMKYPDKARANSSAHVKRYPEKNRENVKRWARENPGKAAALRTAHEQRKRQAMPAWIDEWLYGEIRVAYETAAFCTKILGEKYHVDHIIPLQGKNVCGLHVPWNLQVLPAKENISKGNRCLLNE